MGPGAQTGTAVFINDADAYGVTECAHVSDVCESVRSCLNPVAIPWGPMGCHKSSAGAPWATHVDPMGTPFGRPCLIMDTLVTPWAPIMVTTWGSIGWLFLGGVRLAKGG